MYQTSAINKSSFLAVKLFFILLCCGCNNQPAKNENGKNNTQQGLNMARVSMEINDMNKIFSQAWNSGNVEKLTDLYTKDGKLMEPGYPAATGATEIRSLFETLLKQEKVNINLTTVQLWAMDSITVAEEGTIKETSADGRVTDNGKYIVIWKKEDGMWKLHRDCANSDMK